MSPVIRLPHFRHLGTDPPANTEVTEVVPSGSVWKLEAVSMQLAQGATQTPQPILVIDDGADVIFAALGASAAQTANTTCRYTWAAGLVTSAVLGSGANCFAFAPLPSGLVLEEGWRIRTSTLGIGANTNYAGPSLLVTEEGSDTRRRILATLSEIDSANEVVRGA